MDSSDTVPAEPATPPVKQKNGFIETIRFLLSIFILAVLLRSFVLAAFSIPSGSMQPRMMIGDYLFVAKWPYGYSRYSVPFDILSFHGRILGQEAERGDVVVFHYPGKGDEDYVKRVIGLPGDQVQVRHGQVYLNGKAVPKVRIADFAMPVSPNSPCRAVGDMTREGIRPDGEHICYYPRFRETLPNGKSYAVLDQQRNGPGDNTPVYIVPEGHYFVMGDNRDDSEDSRYPVRIGGVGFLPAENLVGRALITFYSTDGSAEWVKPWTWFSATRWGRIGETY